MRFFPPYKGFSEQVLRDKVLKHGFERGKMLAGEKNCNRVACALAIIY